MQTATLENTKTRQRVYFSPQVMQENPAVTGILPEGYVTGDEFVRRVKEGLRKKLMANGYL